MNDSIVRLLKETPDKYLGHIAEQLWSLATDADSGAFTESRARALLVASGVLDEPSAQDALRTLQAPAAQRVALSKLIGESAPTTAEALSSGRRETSFANWLTLVVAVFADRNDYDVTQLDPASPPGQYTPAGQVLHRSAQFIRQEVQRGATERDKLARQLAFSADLAPTINDIAAESSAEAVLPHYRPPIPVNYPEVANEVLHIDADAMGAVEESAATPVLAVEPAPERSAAISLSEAEITAHQARRLGQRTARVIQQRTQQHRRSLSDVRVPEGVTTAVNSMTQTMRERFGTNAVGTSRLRIFVREAPGGRGIPAVQVKIQARGVKRYVAATTNDTGNLLCTLPIRRSSGYTYLVEITWPQDLGGMKEKKAITLNLNVDEHTLTFYRHV